MRFWISFAVVSMWLMSLPMLTSSSLVLEPVDPGSMTTSCPEGGCGEIGPDSDPNG